MKNRVIDRYSLELEMSGEPENSGLPVRCIATNTDDDSTAESWLTLENARALLNLAYGYEIDIVEHWLQQLQDHHYADLIAERGASQPARCIFNSAEILPFGFNRGDLRPWRDEAQA